MKKDLLYKNFVIFISILVLLMFAFLVFLPHTHNCFDSDCDYCAIVDSIEDFFIAVLICAIVYKVNKFALTFLFFNSAYLFCRDVTLVGLKVKLLD